MSSNVSTPQRQKLLCRLIALKYIGDDGTSFNASKAKAPVPTTDKRTTDKRATEFQRLKGKSSCADEIFDALMAYGYVFQRLKGKSSCADETL